MGDPCMRMDLETVRHCHQLRRITLLGATAVAALAACDSPTATTSQTQPRAQTVVALEAPVIGGFNTGRGGSYAFIDGGFFGLARSYVAEGFPGAEFRGSTVLTDAYLEGIDVLLITPIATNTSS